MRSLVLLGDSVFDNRPYVALEPDTADHLRRLLGPGWTVHLLARDGAVIADIPAQAARLPSPADHAVLSVGGNDALAHVGLLTRRAAWAADVLDELGRIADGFSARYERVVAGLLPRVGRLTLCTIYEAPLDDPRAARLARVPVALLADRIVRVAARHGLDVIDLRAVCTRPEDFVWQIEPSPSGARRIAEAVRRSLDGAPRRFGRVFGD